MGSLDRKLNAYVRFDGMGRVVAGSLILRRKMPKVGKWMQIQGYQCCNPTTTTSTTSTTTTLPSDIRLKDNVVETGGTMGGFTEYTWTWNPKAIALGLGNYPTKGVMAQEVLTRKPEAVLFDSEIGYLRVNYDMIAQA